ncbi:MAG: YebC/PmpR family DNA-binding transcriptional regulator [Spirochaetales bacterium]|nr:YebC/PmpR family DNA-binding transcriptional regulator [Spirochaetales bacterium]
MSGHSKWASIKHKKSAVDAKRGKVFTKMIREISVAARAGGGDPDANPRLRTALLKAKLANMPKDNIDRAIKKGTGEMEGAEYSELTYEAYGPGGVAILIELLTDNRNRTAAEIRHILSRAGGSLGESGSVAYLFKRKGLIVFDASRYTEDAILEVALEAGAEDVARTDGEIEVITEPDDFESVLEALERGKFEHSSAEVTMLADAQVSVPEDKLGQTLRLIDALEDHDDVQNVSTNLDIPEGFTLDE